MQSRAGRKQYGEPITAAFPEDSLRARHTRRLEAELVSISCSALLIRSLRVHVPPRFPRVSLILQKTEIARTVQPYPRC